MTHVVHITTVHSPFDTRIFQKECRTLARAGYRVSLVANCMQAKRSDGVEFVPIRTFRNRVLRMFLSTWSAFWTARQLDAALYHFHDPELLFVGLLLKWTTGAKVIYDVHEFHARKMLARGWMPFVFRRFASITVDIVERSSAPLFDANVCVTKHIADRFPESKTIVVHNYPEIERISSTIGLTSKRNDAILLYTGGWTDHRGIYEVIQALELVRTPDVILRVLGRSVDVHVELAARALPSFRSVEYLGQVPYEQVYEEMHKATIGMVCNQPGFDYDRALPNKLFEYMSAGLPVIASNFPTWQRIVQESRCGLTVDPAKPQEIAEAIDQLLGDPDMRREMGENGCSSVRNCYNWSVEGKKLVAKYRELLA